MKYTWPKFKLCRREQTNLFGSAKYDIKKRRSLPWQSGTGVARYSEYGKLLRNKQSLKRSYLLSEKQFATIVKDKSQKYAKNHDMSHDIALFQFLESRLDVTILRSGLANSIMQARQMVNHGHLLLNGVKHNIPSTFVKVGDVITVREKLQASPLYAQAWSDKNISAPSWLKIDKSKFSIEVLAKPTLGEVHVGPDLLKVIEFYARA